MLWRPPYRTRALLDVSLPPLEGTSLENEARSFPTEGPLIGAFSTQVTELGIWQRLFTEAYPALEVPTLFIQPQWSARERRVLAQGTAPALHKVTFLLEDPDEGWRRAMPEILDRQPFAAVIRNGSANLLMVGLPTEEAWDEFRAALDRL